MQEHFSNPLILPTEKLLVDSLQYCDVNIMNLTGITGTGEYPTIKSDMSSSRKNMAQNYAENHQLAEFEMEEDSTLARLLNNGESYTLSKNSNLNMPASSSSSLSDSNDMENGEIDNAILDIRNHQSNLSDENNERIPRNANTHLDTDLMKFGKPFQNSLEERILDAENVKASSLCGYNIPDCNYNNGAQFSNNDAAPQLLFDNCQAVAFEKRWLKPNELLNNINGKGVHYSQQQLSVDDHTDHDTKSFATLSTLDSGANASSGKTNLPIKQHTGTEADEFVARGYEEDEYSKCGNGSREPNYTSASNFSAMTFSNESSTPQFFSHNESGQSFSGSENQSTLSDSAMMRHMLSMDFDFMNDHDQLIGSCSGSSSNRESNSSGSSDNMSLMNKSWPVPYSPGSCGMTTEVIAPAAAAKKPKDITAQGRVSKPTGSRPQGISGGFMSGKKSRKHLASKSLDFDPDSAFNPLYTNEEGLYSDCMNYEIPNDDVGLQQPQQLQQQPQTVQTKQTQKGVTVRLEQPSYAEGRDDVGTFALINLRKRRAWSRKPGLVSTEEDCSNIQGINGNTSYANGLPAKDRKRKSA